MGQKKKVPDIYKTLQAAIDDQVDKIVKQTKEENERLNKTVVELTDEIDHLLAEVDGQMFFFTEQFEKIKRKYRIGC